MENHGGRKMYKLRQYATNYLYSFCVISVASETISNLVIRLVSHAKSYRRREIVRITTYNKHCDIFNPAVLK